MTFTDRTPPRKDTGVFESFGRIIIAVTITLHFCVLIIDKNRKFAMIMNSFADVYVYMNIFPSMVMPTTNQYTTTAVKHVILHPMAETPLWIHSSITLETCTTISYLTHHIALSPTFLSNNKEP